ncbi:hypothetical protein GALMADRAFT_396257 [Galerina marginata CBS 339.88]|uniref:Secreted protein n=1 Tax=Galerina marginata (strain CBS 339.88) TaxID=685588 RepID=A0A067TS41_GALM3|nr:hypothetical protein GALMADRAFT_396257 [Galerina marginata CBS 339.88]
MIIFLVSCYWLLMLVQTGSLSQILFPFYRPPLTSISPLICISFESVPLSPLQAAFRLPGTLGC